MKKQSFLNKIAPWSLLIVFALICYFSQTEKSITVDEFSHFPSGIYNIITFDWRMDRESPPLIKCIPAVTSIITKPKIDTKLFEKEANTWSLGYHFMYNNWNKYKELFQYGRCIIILLGCLLGWLLYKFGTEIYGKRGGLLALFLFVFNPNILAHSRLITIDIGASCAIFLSIYCFWKYLKRRDSFSLIISGGSLGLAQLSKFTAFFLYPVFIIIMCILAGKRIFNIRDGDNNDKPHLVRDFGHFLVIFFVSLLMINAGYLFSGTFTPIGDYSFLSGPLRKISSFVWGTLPLPLPYDYITGLDSQLAISAGNNPFYTSYLMGEHSLKGWWYYYIIAFTVKNPLAFLVILPITVAIWMKKSVAKIEDSLCIWAPVIVYLFYFSFFTHIPIGVRFLLPVFPLLFLAAGNIANTNFLKNKTGTIIISVLAFAYLIPAISNYPNYLSYFNTIAGGPHNGYLWLIDSNLDWGQDLPGLKKYMEENDIKDIKLGYFGRVDPEMYGIEYELPDTELEEGVHAISVNFLVGRPYYLLKEDPKDLVYVDLDYFEKYRALKPIEIINNTIYIFKVENGGI